MNPVRPAVIIVGLVILLGVFIISLGIFASGSNDDDADPTPTPEVAASTDDQDQGTTSDDDDIDPDPTPAHSDAADDGEEPADESTPEPEAEPTEVAEPEQEPLTEEELQEYQPNELGQIMVLMYHRIEAQENPEDVWTRTPDQFRSDLQWLYDNDFYIIPIRDYVRNEINAPAGKRPVVLTFDDGTVGQFRIIEGADGSVSIDPDSAIGILEDFFNRYDDFGRGGLFSILPLAPFAWPDADDQQEYAGQKLQWLIDNGYELGNHTVGHVNMAEISDEEIRSELARAEMLIRDYVPDVEIDVLAVPFGMYPSGGNTSIFHGWEYEGEEFELEAALMVGAEPAPSPVHVDFDPMWIPRINGDDEQLGQWFSFVEANPGIMYVSDGNPDTITIPENVDSRLVDALDEEKVGDKTIIRY